MALFCHAAVVVATVFCVGLTEALWGAPSFLEFGSCAELTLMEDFDPVKYSGLWFDIESVPNEYQHTKKCVTQNYTWTGEQMNVATKGLTVDDQKVRQSAVMVRDDGTENPASLLVHAAGVPEAPYKVIATDYRTFSCVYSCLDGYVGFMAEFMWVFSRTPTLPAAKIKYCYDIFISMGIHPKKMVPVVQEHPCPYFENLDQMMAESKQHLMKVVGPTESFPFLPLPSANPSTPAAPRVEINEVQEILDVMHEEQEFFGDLKHELESNIRSQDFSSKSNASRTHKSPGGGKEAALPAGGSSVRVFEAADPNTSSASVPGGPLLLLLIVLLQI
ncbi:Crustacyanin-A2 subunit [Chionoecetes opilio]|uniref:Crustacyanin-A2 subunit n=1 Tax=Chionoecetes opilio TaxID=41210 RepID=A0A8J4XN95_CHIOP|nr:Crustacyanin-A2 subunit [Chionoecetes opilio]